MVQQIRAVGDISAVTIITVAASVEAVASAVEVSVEAEVHSAVAVLQEDFNLCEYSILITQSMTAKV